MRYKSAEPVERLYRELAGVLIRSGFEQIELDDEAVQNGTRLTAFVMDELKVDIDPVRGPAVNVSARDGLISAGPIGWRAHFGPATPVEVITAAALAARVVETRARIVASIQEQQDRHPGWEAGWWRVVPGQERRTASPGGRRRHSSLARRRRQSVQLSRKDHR